MKIGIASDHRGYRLKEKLKKYLNKKNFEVIDFGTTSKESVDYPNFGFRLGEAVVAEEIDYGIAICGSGIGISIACNKVDGVRCAKVDTPKEAKATRKDNDANILALNGSMTTFRALDIVDAFFATSFSNLERHKHRIEEITEYEQTRKNVKKAKKTVKRTEEKNNEC